MASNEDHIIYSCTAGATKPLAGRGEAHHRWGRAGGLGGRAARRGARDGARDPGQEQPPLPCGRLEKGLLPDPEVSLGGCYNPLPARALQPLHSEMLEQGEGTCCGRANGGNSSCPQSSGCRGVGAYPGAGAGSREAAPHLAGLSNWFCAYATHWMWNHFSNLKINQRALEIPPHFPSPPLSCPQGGGTEPHPGLASPVLLLAAGAGAPVSAPGTLHQHPLAGGTGVSSAHFMP